jgi:hypothetical protein
MQFGNDLDYLDRIRENGAMPTSKTNSHAMTDEHKAALAKGREEGLAVRRYLEAIESSRPRRGRRRTPASISKRLEGIDAELATADPLTRLHLIQQKKDLSEELDRNADTEDIAELEKQFVKVASAYGDRKGISYGTWRTAGVSAAVLQKAGVARTRG